MIDTNLEMTDKIGYLLFKKGIIDGQILEKAIAAYDNALQINPEDPAMPISTPASWSRDLFRRIGYFYTQELPEDTKAFSSGIFSGGRSGWRAAPASR